MDLVDLVDLVGRIFGKTALQATLRVFGLCGSRVDLVDLVDLVGRWSCPRCSMLDADDCASSCSLWIGGLALDARCSMPTIARPLCSLWTAKKICPLPNFVLCSVSSSLVATFTNGENDHG